MHRSNLKRARQFGHWPARSRWIFFLGICSALFIPLLLVDLGLIVQLLVDRGRGALSQPVAERGEAELPQDWVLGPWVQGRFGQWPLLGQYERCLLVLVGAGAVLSLLEAGTLLLLQRQVQDYALHVVTRMRSAVQAQTFRLGSHELLGVSRSRPEVLFVDKAETLRRGLVDWWQAVPHSFVALALLLLLAFAASFWLALLAVVLSLVIYRFYQGLQRRAEDRSRAWRQRARQLQAALLEHLRLTPLTTGYALERTPGDFFEQRLEEYHAAELRANTREAVVTPALSLIALLAAAFLMLVVGLRPDMAVSSTVLLGAALICAYYPAARIYRLHRRLSEADMAAGEIFAYLDREPSVVEAADARALQPLRQEIKLDRVTLADRQGQRLLDNVSLTIPAKQRTAIVASDPQTPLALAGLFVRYYDPAAGRLLYDNQDIHQASLDSLRSQAVLITEKGPVFPGTIAENIACGDTNYTTHQLTEAAKKAQIHELILELPQGLATPVGGDELQLSDHQAIRIALARALLRDPSLLVIQEPAGPFDEATAQQLEEALRMVGQQRTVIMLPARLSTLRSAERIYLFHEGHLHAEGTHAELLQNSELYRHLNYLQFNAFRGKVKW